MQRFRWFAVLSMLLIGVAAGAEQPEAVGGFQEGAEVAGGQRPPERTVVNAGDLGLTLGPRADGVRLLSLFDSSAGEEFLAGDHLPLFTLTLRNAKSKQEIQLTADAGWNRAEVLPPDAAGGIEIRWREPKDKRLEELHDHFLVRARVAPDCDARAFHWKFGVENAGKYGLPGEQIRITKLTAEGTGEPFTVPRLFRRELTLQPGTVWAWELASP